MQGYLRYGHRTAAPSTGGIRRPQGRAYTTKCAKAHEAWRGWKKSHRRERRSWRKPLSTTLHGGRSGSRTKPPTAGPTGILDAALTPWNDPVDNFGTVNSPPHGGPERRKRGRAKARPTAARRREGGRDERGAGDAGAGAEQPSRREPPAPPRRQPPGPGPPTTEPSTAGGGRPARSEANGAGAKAQAGGRRANEPLPCPGIQKAEAPQGRSHHSGWRSTRLERQARGGRAVRGVPPPGQPPEPATESERGDTVRRTMRAGSMHRLAVA